MVVSSTSSRVALERRLVAETCERCLGLRRRRCRRRVYRWVCEGVADGRVVVSLGLGGGVDGVGVFGWSGVSFVVVEYVVVSGFLFTRKREGQLVMVVVRREGKGLHEVPA